MNDSNSNTPECHYNQSVEFFYNASGKNISHLWHAQDYVVMGLGLTVCGIIILANMLVIIAIGINRHFHFPIYYLLGNLAATDLLSGIFYINLMFHTGPWTINLSKPQWFVRQGLLETGLTASLVNLLAVAVERHRTIFTMQLHSNMSNRAVVLLILTIWAVAFVVGFVPMMGWHCICDLENCSTMAPLYSRSYLVFWAVFNLLTFSVMVTMYTHIFIYVHRHTQRMTQHTTQNRHRETIINLMKTVFIILGTFVVCWTPGQVVLLLDGLQSPAEYILNSEKYCLVLAVCNSLVNPIIYSFRDKEMRSTFKQILCSLCRRCEKSATSPRPNP
ncbi:hypothetical protein COCON_G00206630 [Conger conger]|uniref:G-protein coupled receptors family 1 profile domain-containing protein n=1 Tax=Conger conger TaxID=82655 RepID=A0A9Q1CZS5_CONCO|nr:lysophosphatidic acid receptor 2a [Conger conger]KAJ8254051.1 hypothetical protein COCON_G00206630 [Conger conger]